MNITKEEFVSHIRRLGDGSVLPRYMEHGLCQEIMEFLCGRGIARKGQFTNSLSDFCKAVWPHYSGHVMYPVPEHLQNLSSWEAALAYMNSDETQMWNSELPYGRARLKLCTDFADWLELHWDEVIINDIS